MVAAPAAPGQPPLTGVPRAHRAWHPSATDPPAYATTPAAPSTAAAAEPGTDRLAGETRLLGQVLAELRRGGDPRRALTGLDTYAARYPDGLLAAEAARARVDALWLAGRLPETQAALGALALGPGARDRELRLIRAELNARTDCQGALADFAIVASEVRDGPLAERAAWGRAACRDRLGDVAGARAALADYVRRFPDGAHAAAARARLEK
jgi:TolA-binding protein